jgi:hypothetical protein
MGVLQNLFEDGKVEMGLIFKLAFGCLSFLAKIITVTSLEIDKDPRQTDPLKVWPMLPIKRFTTGTDKATCA